MLQEKKSKRGAWIALGCVAAIQLDEGGSSTYLSQREGESDSDGGERFYSPHSDLLYLPSGSGRGGHRQTQPGLG